MDILKKQLKSSKESEHDKKNNHYFMCFFFSFCVKCICKHKTKQYHQNGSILKAIDKTVKLTCSPNDSLS